LDCNCLSRHRRLLVLALGLIVAGCSERTGEVSQAQTSLGWLGSMYGMYISQNGGEAPKSIEDLQKYVAKKATPERLAQLGVASAGELFVSPRDGQPYSLVKYAELPPPGTAPPPIVLYESVGKNGRRAVAQLGGGTDIIDEEQLSQMLPATQPLKR
jgi:hypothetical protein